MKQLKSSVVFNTGYNFDNDVTSLENGFNCPEDTLTQQQFGDEVNINTIVRNFGLTHELPPEVPIYYADVTDMPDYQTSLNFVRQADANFMLLPADLRSRFDNNPQLLLNFLSNDANRDEAIKLGLIDAKVDSPTGSVGEAAAEVPAG